MTEHEELLQLREEKKQQLKRARINAATFGVLAIVALIAFVYAFFQQTAANKARVEAELNAKLAIEARALADENVVKYQAAADRQTKIADSLRQACQQNVKKPK